MYHKDKKSRQVYNENTNATLVILGQAGLSACFAVFALYFRDRIFNYALKNTFLYMKSILCRIFAMVKKKNLNPSSLSSLVTGRTLK